MLILTASHSFVKVVLFLRSPDVQVREATVAASVLQLEAGRQGWLPALRELPGLHDIGAQVCLLHSPHGIHSFPFTVALYTPKRVYIMAVSIPPKLQEAAIAQFARRAAQVESVKPIIAYWCK